MEGTLPPFLFVKIVTIGFNPSLIWYNKYEFYFWYFRKNYSLKGWFTNESYRPSY